MILCVFSAFSKHPDSKPDTPKVSGSSSQPYSQRQSKAEVAAFMALKRAQQSNPSQSASMDKTFAATMQEYNA